MRRRARGGETIASIARAAGVSEPTVRKYVRMGDLSPEMPRAKWPESGPLAPYEARRTGVRRFFFGSDWLNCPDYLWLRLPDANIRTALARVSALGEQGPGRIPDAPGQRQLQPNFFYVVHSAAKHLCDHVWGLPGLLCQENPHRWTPRGIERSRSSGWPWSLPTRRRAACMMV